MINIVIFYSHNSQLAVLLLIHSLSRPNGCTAIEKTGQSSFRILVYQTIIAQEAGFVLNG